MSNIGKRIMIIGSPGSGKSTFSRKLSDITGLPLIHLDKEFWNSGWIETPKDEWIKKQKSLVSGDQWIIEGNYGGTIGIRVEKADTIICFQLSRVICLFRYFKRVITNLNKVRPYMPDGCNEKIDFDFMKYIWNFPEISGKINNNIIENNRDKQLIIFKKRKDAGDFIMKF